MKATYNSKLYYLALLGIFALVTAIYYPTLNAYFITDDFMWVTLGNKSWQDIPSFFIKGSQDGFFRPLIDISFLLDYSVYGLNHTGYHISNLIMHMVNTILVFGLCYILSNNKGVTVLATLIFALHPMHTESISYISGRSELLYSMFFLTALICFIKHLQSKRAQGLYYASLVAFALSLLNKETAACLIFVLFLSELLLKFQRGAREKPFENWRKYIPYLLILIVYLVQRQFLIRGKIYPIRYDNILIRPIFYFAKVFAPINIQNFINQNLALHILIGLSFVFIVGYTCYHLYPELKKYKYLILYCVFWIVIIFFPVYFNPGERYAYLPSIGSSMIWALIIIQAMQKIKLRSAFGAHLVLGVIIAGILSFSYIRITERNTVFFRVGEVAKKAISQLLNQRPNIPRGAVLFFINPPEKWIIESGIWARPFYTTLDDAVQISYRDPSLKIFYNDSEDLNKMEDKISFLLANDFQEMVEKNKNVFVFEYQAGKLIERTAEFKQILNAPIQKAQTQKG
jgi:hypothetical protein